MAEWNDRWKQESHLYDERQRYGREAHSRSYLLIFLSILLMGMCVLSGCGAGGGSTVSNPSTPGTPTPTTHSVTLSWQASRSPQVMGYVVYRRALSSNNFELITSSPTPSLTYVDLDVQAGESLGYVVRAVDERMNESGPSNEVQVTIPN